MKKQIKIIISLIMIMVILLGAAVNAETANDANLQLDKTTGSLTINKSVEGTTFDIYKVDDDETSKAMPTDDSILGTIKSATIGTSGKVVFSELELGRYLVIESSSAANASGKIANFLVDIPTTEPGVTGSDPDKLIYDVEVTPKDNTTYGVIKLRNIGIYGNAEELLSGSAFMLQRRVNGVWTNSTSENLTTDSDGEIIIEGLQAGEYRFIQQSVEGGYILDNKTTYTFAITSSEDGSTVVTPTIVTVINEKPTITKEVVNPTESVKIGDTINYKLTIDVPETIDRLNTFEIKDIFPEGLTFQEDTLQVFINNMQPKGTNTYSTNWEESTRTLIITILDTSYLNTNYVIEVTYDTIVNENASASSDGIINQALLKYSTIVDTDYEDNVNEVVTDTSTVTIPIYTGGFWIEKRAQNVTGDLLSGAVFKIADSLVNAISGNYMTDVNGNEITLTTDENGKASYKGITFGKYYLVEVKAPTYVDSEGEQKSYNLLRTPQEIEVNSSSYESTTPAKIIVNKTGFELPYTGGIGTLIIALLGLGIVLLGVFIMKKAKDKSNTN